MTIFCVHAVPGAPSTHPGQHPVPATQWRTLPAILTADDIAALQSIWQDALRELAA